MNGENNLLIGEMIKYRKIFELLEEESPPGFFERLKS